MFSAYHRIGENRYRQRLVYPAVSADAQAGY